MAVSRVVHETKKDGLHTTGCTRKTKVGHTVENELSQNSI
jgi:hypothetical protein